MERTTMKYALRIPELGKLLLLICLLGGFAAPTAAADQVVLQRILHKDGINPTHLVLQFSALPRYSMRLTGQRLDLVLEDTQASASLAELPEDGAVIKVLLAKDSGKLIVSFLLRQPPLRVISSPMDASRLLSIDLYWQPQSSRPLAEFSTQGGPSGGGGGEESSTLNSKYAGHWERFFNDYRTPLVIPAPIRYSLPPLPPLPPYHAVGDYALALRQVARGEWAAAARLLERLRQTPVDPPIRHLLSGLYGEALLRIGRADQAQRILYGLDVDQVLGGLKSRLLYLRANALAAVGRSYQARQQALALLSVLEPGSPLLPLDRLLLVETDLATGNGSKALARMRGAKPWPTGLQRLAALRLADALAVNGRRKKALVAYRHLLAGGSSLGRHPFSLNQAALLWEQSGEFQKASRLFTQLAAAVKRGPVAGLAHFAAADALLRDGKRDAALQQMANVRSDFSGTEAANRAWMKILDVIVLTGNKKQREGVVESYGVLGEEAVTESLRREAALKEAILEAMDAHPDRCVADLSRFLRDNRTGDLPPLAEVLLGEELPKVVRERLVRGDDLGAVVLVEQHREALLKGKIDWSFLHDVARAFSRLGLARRGCKVYFYMLQQARAPRRREGIYLPLAQLLFQQGEYARVEKYARAYLAAYPTGPDRAPLYGLLARALVHQSRVREAADLLAAVKATADPALDLTAARIFWQVGRYSEVVRWAAKLQVRGAKAPAEGTYLLARALYRLGRKKQALPLFRQLAGKGPFADEARFRCAQIELTTGDRQEGLKVLRGLAETGSDPLWRELARQSLPQAQP